ncbi:hypothetical protein CPAR01_03514 [Colletotrichum paranaense]|uniref:Secreted peptide n=1 Tax=Colletotrichum paranaense TaxID=1914294 RepID=A0ABQ9T2K9_9PEZI|nr:uncharacterized protein CPAR01_03514 [Colletotrichum paranaense]KAK1546012.1 hypothetical protein CPAR01_03514 [Colletotrichum paranaense]
MVLFIGLQNIAVVLLVLLLLATPSRVHAFSVWLGLLHLPGYYLPGLHLSRNHSCMYQTWASRSNCCWQHHHGRQFCRLSFL